MQSSATGIQFKVKEKLYFQARHIKPTCVYFMFGNHKINTFMHPYLKLLAKSIIQNKTYGKLEAINESASWEKCDPTGMKVWSTSFHLSGDFQPTWLPSATLCTLSAVHQKNWDSQQGWISTDTSHRWGWGSTSIFIDEGGHIYKEKAKLLRFNSTHFKTVL